MKKIQFLTAVLLCLFANRIIAQNTDSAAAKPLSYWKHQAQTGLNISQSSFSSNWKAGGANNISLGGFFNLLSKYEKQNWNVASDLQLALGFLNNGTATRKTSDRIFYDLKLGYKISSKWDLFVSTNFQTQFTDGFLYDKGADKGDSLISTFMSPGYLTTSLGLEYRPNTYLSGRFGIGTLRQTFVLNDNFSKMGMYGVDKGSNIRNQAILQMVWSFDKDIAKNINLKVRSQSFWDYIKFDKSGSVVQRLDLNLAMKVNKYISTNIQAVALYDFDQDKDWQTSQILALGILYNWAK
jgi:hypothetical protein